MLKLIDINKNLEQFSLKNIDLEISENEYFVILGPSGAGKTVLLEIMAGLYQPTKGEIFAEDQNITNLPPEKRNIGLVYQDYALFPNMNVITNIGFGLKIKKTPKIQIQNKVKNISKLLEIENILERNVQTLSGGEAQRVALARALVLNPKIVLLDEPLSALDAPLREKLRKELKRIRAAFGTTFVQVTHDFEEAVFLADRLAVMKDGEIVQVGKTQEIMLKPANSFIAEFVGVKNIFQGQVKNDSNGLKWFESNGLRIQINTELEGSCYISLPAEEIILSKEKITSSARNCLNGKIVEILPRGRLREVIVDVGQNLATLLTPRSIEEMNLAVGEKIWATFKTSAVHVF
ncbi:MAG: tungstate ABC transporter ATP-binding protein WtpC [Pseudomonadota bacterium]